MDATHDENGTRRLVVIADDLTGAVETAALLVAPDGTSPTVLLDLTALPTALARRNPLVIDADLRHRDPATAQAALAALLRALPEQSEVFVKIDSLLRGPLPGVAGALRGRPTLVSTAVPATRRSVVDGVVRVDGVPLQAAGAWDLEPHPAPSSIADALGAPGIASVDLVTVRDARFAETLVELNPALIVADAESPSDLDRIAASWRGTLMGAAGLAQAWAARNAHVSVSGCISGDDRRGDPVCLIGTASPSAAVQIDACESAGVRVLRLASTEIAGAELPEGEPVVVSVVQEHGIPEEIEHGFAALARRALCDRDLVVSGGATARAVLAALEIGELEPQQQVHPGAVISRARDGRRVVTRPGSYGDPNSLQAIIACLTLGTRRSTS